MDSAITAFRRTTINRLLGMRDPATGVWTGELSSSALSTALTLAALLKDPSCTGQVDAAVAWLLAHQNADGGWGDTPVSPSNLSTTLLVRSALRAEARRRPSERPLPALQAVDSWLLAQMGGLSFTSMVRALREIYQQDGTFAIPILTFVAICEGDDNLWGEIPALPFLAALLPQPLYRFFKLEVVSYALPALIAIGMCGNRGRARWKRFSLSSLFAKPLLAKLERIQPGHGGFLDATPLTAFVAVALEKLGYGEHPVIRRAKAFLVASLRADGSCAIDSNLRIWVTSLATRALLAGRVEPEQFPFSEREQIARWLLSKQFQTIHPYTGARPGGWAWTDCAGGVPDADDTSGALMALHHLKRQGVELPMEKSVRAGVRWLMDLQNRDGGIPTFCKGWGRLPFDQSCPDISAHAFLACLCWKKVVPEVDATLHRLLEYLSRAQCEDGSWSPLWFGNENAPDKRNPVVGTARVVDALVQAFQAGYLTSPRLERMIGKGVQWLLDAQHRDGSWGAGVCGSREETGLAVIALKKWTLPAAQQAVKRGHDWLLQQGEDFVPSPIGLYFSLLWYHEKMYPWVWTLEALAENDREP